MAEKKMTWDERRQMHLDLYNEHAEKAAAAIRRAIEEAEKSSLFSADALAAWDEYKRESRLREKHRGIAEAMWTRKYGRV